jgi:hypothetical protein
MVKFREFLFFGKSNKRKSPYNKYKVFFWGGKNGSFSLHYEGKILEASRHI